MRKRGKDGEKEKFSLVSKLEKFKNQAFSGGSKTEQDQIEFGSMTARNAIY